MNTNIITQGLANRARPLPETLTGLCRFGRSDCAIRADGRDYVFSVEWTPVASKGKRTMSNVT